jgi:hypothetical protein
LVLAIIEKTHVAIFQRNSGLSIMQMNSPLILVSLLHCQGVSNSRYYVLLSRYSQTPMYWGLTVLTATLSDCESL